MAAKSMPLWLGVAQGATQRNDNGNLSEARLCGDWISSDAFVAAAKPQDQSLRNTCSSVTIFTRQKSFENGCATKPS